MKCIECDWIISVTLSVSAFIDLEELARQHQCYLKSGGFVVTERGLYMIRFIVCAEIRETLDTFLAESPRVMALNYVRDLDDGTITPEDENPRFYIGPMLDAVHYLRQLGERNLRILKGEPVVHPEQAAKLILFYLTQHQNFTAANDVLQQMSALDQAKCKVFVMVSAMNHFQMVWCDTRFIRPENLNAIHTALQEYWLLLQKAETPIPLIEHHLITQIQECVRDFLVIHPQASLVYTLTLLKFLDDHQTPL